jgi:hypothetical protein
MVIKYSRKTCRIVFLTLQTVDQSYDINGQTITVPQTTGPVQPAAAAGQNSALSTAAVASMALLAAVFQVTHCSVLGLNSREERM